MTSFFLQALAEVGTPSVLGLIVIGVLFGIVGGSIPGFTVTMAILVVFPFTFAMDPVSGVSLMVGVFVGGYSGGIVSGVMLGIPGGIARPVNQTATRFQCRLPDLIRAS